MKTLVSAVAVIALALTSACTTGAQDSSPPKGSNAQEPTDGSDSTVSPEAEPKPLKFGQSHTYEDGITVTVGKPSAATPSQTASVTDYSGDFVKFDITIVNKSGKTFNPESIYVTMQAGNTEAEEEFDSENGMDGSPTTPILDGREARWTTLWDVDNPDDLVLQITPDQGVHKPVIFTSK